MTVACRIREHWSLRGLTICMRINRKLWVSRPRRHGQPVCCLIFSEPLKNRLNLTRLVELDRQFCEFAKLQRSATPRCGWAKTVRLALGMSSEALGTRLGMSAQGVRKLEQAEANGSISLKTLFRLADGLDCDVHYMLVPRASLVEQVLKRSHEVAGESDAAPAPDCRRAEGNRKRFRRCPPCSSR